MKAQPMAHDKIARSELEKLKKRVSDLENRNSRALEALCLAEKLIVDMGNNPLGGAAQACGVIQGLKAMFK